MLSKTFDNTHSYAWTCRTICAFMRVGAVGSIHVKETTHTERDLHIPPEAVAAWVEKIGATAEQLFDAV